MTGAANGDAGGGHNNGVGGEDQAELEMSFMTTATSKTELRGDITDLEERLEVTKTAVEGAEDELLYTRKHLAASEERRVALTQTIQFQSESLDAMKHELTQSEETNGGLEEKEEQYRQTIQFQSESLNAMKHELTQSEEANGGLEEKQEQYRRSISALRSILRNNEETQILAEQKILEFGRRIEQLTETTHYLREMIDSSRNLNNNNDVSAFGSFGDYSETQHHDHDHHLQDMSDDVPNATLTVDESLLGVSMLAEQMEEGSICERTNNNHGGAGNGNGDDGNDGTLSEFDDSFYNDAVVENAAATRKYRPPPLPRTTPRNATANNMPLTTPRNTTGLPLNATPRTADMYYQQKLSQLREEVQTADEGRRGLQKERDDAMDVLLRTENELQDVRGKLVQKEEEMSRQVSDLQHRIRRVEESKANVEAANSNEKNRLVNELDDLKQSLAIANRNLAEYRERNDVLLSDAADVQREGSEATSALKTRISELREDVVQLRTEVASQELKLQSERTVLRVTQDQTDSLRSELDSTKTALECVKKESNTSKTAAQRWEAEVSRLQPLVLQKEGALKESLASAANAKNALEVESRKLVNVEKKLRVLEQCYATDKTEADEAIRNFEERLAVTDQQHSDARLQLDDALNHNATLRNDLRAKEEECRTKQRQRVDLSGQVDGLERELTLLQTSAADVNEKLVNATATVDANKETIGQLQNSIRITETNLRQKENLLLDSEDEVRHLREELAHCEDVITKLENELAQSEEDHRSYASEKEQRIAMLTNACHERQEMFDDKVQSLKLERDALTSDLENMVEILKEELDASNNANREADQRSTDVVRELRHSLEESRNELTRCTSSIEVLEAEVLRQNAAQADLEQEILDTRGRAKDFERKYKAETKKCQTSNTQLDATRQELAATTSDLQQLEHNRNVLFESYTNAQQELESSLMDVERMKTKYQDNEFLLKKNIEEFTTRNAELRAELSEASATKEGILQQELDHSQQTNNDTSATHNAKLHKKCVHLKEYIKELTANCRGLENDCRGWSDEYQTQSGELERRQKEVERLSGQVTVLEQKLVSIRRSSDRYKYKMEHIRETLDSSPDTSKSYSP